jgi:CRISPR/Cas system-associated exonuclease Cas4 (RecB family)
MSNDVGERQHESLERWRELLRLEKQRRGVPDDKLLFVGAADLAEFWWCAQKSLLETGNNELLFFANYVFEGFRMSTPDLNDEVARFMVSKLIRGDERAKAWLLGVVDGNYKKIDLDKVLKGVAEKMKRAETEVYPAVKIGDRVLTPIRRDDKLVVLEGLKEGDECDLIKGDHSDVCREVLRAACAGPERIGWKLERLKDRRLARGVTLHDILAERRPTIFWAKEWDRYVVVGVPDGIGEDFVYEFKSTTIRRLDKYMLPVARAQANIYAWLFKRQRWVVEIFSCIDLKLYRWEGEADYGDVERTLKGFKAAEEGGEILPPMCWKCDRCKYRGNCGLRDKCRPSRRQGI